MGDFSVTQEGGPEALMAVIEMHDIWRGLTKHQRKALIEPQRAISPQTITALERRGLWNVTQPTPLGKAVAALRPDAPRLLEASS